MSIDNKTVEDKIAELQRSKEALVANLQAHEGALQALQQLLDADKELAVPVEMES